MGWLRNRWRFELRKSLIFHKIRNDNLLVDVCEFPEDEFPIVCPRCRYDLRGLPDGQCPECGVEFVRGRLIVVEYLVEGGSKHWRIGSHRVSPRQLWLLLVIPLLGTILGIAALLSSITGTFPGYDIIDGLGAKAVVLACTFVIVMPYLLGTSLFIYFSLMNRRKSLRVLKWLDKHSYDQRFKSSND